ncbi:MAG TPA: DNA-processing protein DprA [Gaiellaceae bacterium]|nr:DNA-processing protein DprA [Gaiellaceae bacterium]
MTITSVARGRPGYPSLLAELHDPPTRLYVRGKSSAVLGLPAVAVVGARSCSAYGAQVARALSRELAAAGLVVVSGLARGIDGEAHRGALAGGGLTVAVLGCGIDRDYPRAHAELARRIAAGGAVVSEYPAGVEPAPWQFPARNRIIAGLARATVVVEARQRSGALITADFALELGREVFAVPGEITSGLSAGTNDLIRQGATPLLAVGDVLEALGVERAPPAVPETLSAEARAVLVRLTDGARSPDELVRETSLSSARVAVAITELELAALVVPGDGVYRRASEGRVPLGPTA